MKNEEGKINIVESTKGKVDFSTVKNDKEQIINLVILDRSGSMQNLRNAAIDGFNETINGIRVAQEKYREQQDHYISLLSFCNCKMVYHYENTPINEVENLTEEEYVPCCCTPLFDAMGLAIKRLRKSTKGMSNYSVVVTIITDGYENASKEYSNKEIKHLVEELTEEGWVFVYMGTNHDVTKVTDELSIKNRQLFENSEEGLGACWDDISSANSVFFERMAHAYKNSASLIARQEARESIISTLSDNYLGKNNTKKD